MSLGKEDEKPWLSKIANVLQCDASPGESLTYFSRGVQLRNTSCTFLATATLDVDI